MATHSSILAWRKPRREEPGRLQSTGWHRHTDGTKVTQYQHFLPVEGAVRWHLPGCQHLGAALWFDLSPERRSGTKISDLISVDSWASGQRRGQGIKSWKPVLYLHRSLGVMRKLFLLILKTGLSSEFPGSPGVRAAHGHYRWHRFDPWSGN